MLKATKVTTPGSKQPQPERPQPERKGRPQPGRRSILDAEPSAPRADVGHVELNASSDEEEQFVELQKAKGGIFAIKEWEKTRAQKEGRPADVSSY